MPTVTHIIDSNLPVYATGDQTISGTKTFSGFVLIPNSTTRLPKIPKNPTFSLLTGAGGEITGTRHGIPFTNSSLDQENLSDFINSQYWLISGREGFSGPYTFSTPNLINQTGFVDILIGNGDNFVYSFRTLTIDEKFKKLEKSGVFALLSGEKLGVGTLNPTEKLHIDGNLKVDGGGYFISRPTVNGTGVLLIGDALNLGRFVTEYYEEFLNSPGSGLLAGGLQRATISPGQVISQPTDGVQGVVRCETTTDPTAGLRAAVSTNSMAIHFGQGQEIETVWRVKPTINLFSTSLNGVYGVGFANDLGTTAFAQRGLFFRSSGQDWSLVIRNDGAEYVASVNPQVQTSLDTWYTMRIIVNSNASVVSGIINNTGIATFNMTGLSPSSLRLNETGRQTSWTAGLRRQSPVATGVGLDIDFGYLKIGNNNISRW
jgi:hypothetical protein